MAKRKRTNNDLQSIISSSTNLTKNREELGCSGRVAVPAPLVASVVLLAVTSINHK
jgi:hypothetical protein